MRTKLFLAFILVISLAIFSNVIFERLIIADFDEFLQGKEEDSIYWVMASLEGSYKGKQWDGDLIHEALHWGLMLGFESYVEDASGSVILSSTDVLSSTSPNMLKMMNSLFKLPSGSGDFTWYPLYSEGEEIGKLYIRPLERLGTLPLKEKIFRERGIEFLVISFLIAGGGALFLAILFTVFLSKPVRRLTVAAEKIAKGDFSVKDHEHKSARFLKNDEIERLTETFYYMSEALRREDALRKHLTANIAHELRTPLTIIKGNLEAIEDGVMSDIHAVMGNIKSEIQRIISLVQGIEDITSAEASFFKKGEPEEINLREFIESIAEGMKKVIEEKGLFIKTAGPSILVRTYPEKLHIILKNLLTNAYKFTGRGGIEISWGECKNNGRAGFYVSVDDTGEGIPEGERRRIFERFYKDKDSSGTGLGLAIVKELTEVMGGKVEVDSSANNGARFTIMF
jgi:two-component system, OmpR family, sensor histidine kinase BaeS